MDQNAFLQEFAEVLDLNAAALGPEHKFSGPEGWDSLAVISTIALIDDHFGVTVRADDFIHCSTLGDLLAMVAGKKSS